MQHRNIPPPRDQRLVFALAASSICHCVEPLTTIMPRRLWLWRSSILRRLRFLRSTPPSTLPCLVFVFHSPAAWSISCQFQRTPAEKLRFWPKVHSHNPKTWFRNVISQIARWLFSRRIADRRTLWRRLIMCVSSQVKDPTCGFTSVPIKNHCLTDRRFSIIRIWRWLEVEFINGVLVIEDYISRKDLDSGCLGWDVRNM